MADSAAPLADVGHDGDNRRSIPAKWLLLAASLALLIIGIAFGEPVAPRGDEPQMGVSPIVRRSLADAQEAPRLEQSTTLDPPRARGELREDSVDSAILGRELPIGIYLPPGYADSTQRYPVLYALHGLAGYYAEWVDFGAADAADSLFSNLQVPPFIMVFPQGDQSYWFNHPQGGDAWADYLTDEVIPLVDSRYRTIPRRTARAIGGLSMGATGALQFGFRRPDLFSVVGAHSPSFRNTPDADVFWFFSDPGYYATYDPFVLAQTTNSGQRLRIWLDVGDADPWRDRVEEFHQLLLNLGIAHRWSVGQGIHEGTYWGPRLPEYLTFYGYALVNQAPPAATPTPLPAD